MFEFFTKKEPLQQAFFFLGLNVPAGREPRTFFFPVTSAGAGSACAFGTELFRELPHTKKAYKDKTRAVRGEKLPAIALFFD